MTSIQSFLTTCERLKITKHHYKHLIINNITSPLRNYQNSKSSTPLLVSAQASLTSLLVIHSFQFSAPIFKIVPNQNGTKIAIELRNGKAKETYFALLDVQKKQLIWEETAFAETWRIGLLAMTDTILLLHPYANAKIPDNKGIYAVDILQQTILWEQANYYFEGLISVTSSSKSSYCILAYEIEVEQKKYVVLDLQTGNIDQKQTETYQNRQPSPILADSLVPTYHASNSVYLADIALFLRPFLPSKASLQAADYLEIGNKIIMAAFYELDLQEVNFQEKSTQFITQLFIFDSEGNKIVNEITNQVADNQDFSNTFFVVGKKLIALKGKETILVIEI
jgi:hypothetical protein